MITAASSNSDQTYASIEPSNTAEAETTTATAETAPPAELKEELSSTLKMAEALPTTPAWSQNIEQILTIITKLIAMILSL